jgi:hypothetical protein
MVPAFNAPSTVARDQVPKFPAATVAPALKVTPPRSAVSCAVFTVLITDDPTTLARCLVGLDRCRADWPHHEQRQLVFAHKWPKPDGSPLGDGAVRDTVPLPRDDRCAAVDIDANLGVRARVRSHRCDCKALLRGRTSPGPQKTPATRPNHGFRHHAPVPRPIPIRSQPLNLLVRIFHPQVAKPFAAVMPTDGLPTNKNLVG